MRTSRIQLALGALLFTACAITACTNQDGAGGTSEGNAGEAYELRNKDHLVPSMDSVATEKDTTDTMGNSSGE